MTLEDILNGSNEALKEFYAAHRDKCVNWLVSEYHISRDSAKEIFQSAVVIMYDNLIRQKVTDLETKASTYVYSVCRNLSRDHIRAQVKNHNYAQHALHTHILHETHNPGKDLLESRILKMKELLLKLGERCRQLLQLFYYRQMSYAQICQVMNYQNEHSAKNNKYKCIVQLRKLWAEHLKTKTQVS